MTLISPDPQRSSPPLPDPFLAPPAVARRPRRPRLLSYAGRWGRARRWIPEGAVRIVDVGCSFGYGSAALLGGRRSGRRLVGIERDPDHLAAAAVRYPWIPVIDADATDLPIADAVADAVTMLDIVEHLDRPEAALNEAHRVLRAGGVLIVSVPHRGLLERLDALNLYERLRRHRPQWRPLAPATTSGGHEHRHYTLPELEALLAPGFAVDRVARTGTGVQELISLALIAIAPRVPPALARILALGHLAVYVLDDLLPLGRKSYHLMVRARRVGDVRS